MDAAGFGITLAIEGTMTFLMGDAMKTTMLGLAMAAMAATVYAETNGETQGMRPAKARVSSAAIARLYDRTWSEPVLAPEKAPKAKALYEKSIEPRLAPSEAVAALAIPAPALAPILPAVAPIVPVEAFEALKEYDSDALEFYEERPEALEASAESKTDVYTDSTGTLSTLSETPAVSTKGR